jgi:hypothetical protein
MQKAGVISDYLETLTDALRFDRSLSRIVRQEVEDHLWEAVAADRSGDLRGGARRAIANFGDPHAIAAQFAVLALTKQARSLGVVVILAIAGVFAIMKARVAWYAAAQWAMHDDLRVVSGLVLLIDRYAFWLSVIIGIGCWAYISSRRIPARLDAGYRRQFRLFLFLSVAAAAALVVSVISDGVLTGFQLLGAEFRTGSRGERPSRRPCCKRDAGCR